MDLKSFKFKYNCKNSITWGFGSKEGVVLAKSKEEAREKIKLYLKRVNGVLAYELF